MQKKNIFILANGDVLELGATGGEVTDKISCQPRLVDGLGIGDVGSVVLSDQQKLSQEGLLVVVVTIKRGTGEILAGPDIVSRGFVYVRESSDLMDEAQKVVVKTLDTCKAKNVQGWSKIKNQIRDDLREYLWRQMKRNPMILPIVMEVE